MVYIFMGVVIIKFKKFVQILNFLLAQLLIMFKFIAHNLPLVRTHNDITIIFRQ